MDIRSRLSMQTLALGVVGMGFTGRLVCAS